MPSFLIERNVPGAEALSAEQVQDIAKTSNRALRELGPDIQWVQSYVTKDKITCVYIAANEQIIREHARIGGFPADRISQIQTVMNPTSAEATSAKTAR